MSKPRTLTVIALALVTTAACRPAAINSVEVGNACEILSRDSVASVQGEQVLDVTPSRSTSGDLSIGQCFYKLPTYSRSVNLEVTSGPERSINDYWNKRFRDRAPTEEEEEERERQRESGKAVEEEKEKETERSSGPQAVSGLGDEAFWVASQINGALFVRKGNAIYRVTLGGADDAAAKLERATTLSKSFLDKK